ncbi:MAG: HAD family hydrolase [Eubacteriales bacterium]|nr:HAD family hydrolase [Eubacteriales bacterium]
MKKLKYIICDLDGTLLNDKKTISPKQVSYIRELRKRKGVRFGFASGRTLNSLLPLAEEMGLLDVCDVLVANNGVDIYDVKDKKNTQTLLVSVEDIQEIIRMMEPYKDFMNVIIHSKGGLYGLCETERIHRVMKMNHYSNEQYHSLYEGGYDPAARVSLLFDAERLSDVEKVVADSRFPSDIQAFQSDVDIYDLTRKGVSKANGVELYVSRFGDTLEEVIAFGDSGNDREMMKRVGVSVAMNNAIDEILQIADYVTEKTNNEDGVMEFLKTMEQRF